MNLQLSKMQKHYPGLFNQTSFLADEVHVQFEVPGPFIGRIILRKIALLEIAGFRVVKPREKTGPFPKNYPFAHRSRTSNWLVPLDSTKSYRYTTGRQTRQFITVGLAISSSTTN